MYQYSTQAHMITSSRTRETFLDILLAAVHRRLRLTLRALVLVVLLNEFGEAAKQRSALSVSSSWLSKRAYRSTSAEVQLDLR